MFDWFDPHGTITTEHLGNLNSASAIIDLYNKPDVLLDRLRNMVLQVMKDENLQRGGIGGSSLCARFLGDSDSPPPTWWERKIAESL